MAGIDNSPLSVLISIRVFLCLISLRWLRGGNLGLFGAEFLDQLLDSSSLEFFALFLGLPLDLLDQCQFLHWRYVLSKRFSKKTLPETAVKSSLTFWFFGGSHEPPRLQSVA